MPTTEVSIRSSLSEDLYVIMSTIDPESKLGTFRAIVRPLVIWIWIGAVLLILGTLLAMSPSLNQVLAQRTTRGARTKPAIATGALIALILALLVGVASAQDQAGSSSLHAGTVVMNNDTERDLFSRLLCMCGDCQRLQLSTCGCSWAVDARAEIRTELAAGVTPTDIVEAYRKEHGEIAISIPPDKGLGRAAWALPLGLGGVALLGLFALGVRWRKRATATRTGQSAASDTEPATEAREVDPYDARLDRELEDFDR